MLVPPALVLRAYAPALPALFSYDSLPVYAEEVRERDREREVVVVLILLFLYAGLVEGKSMSGCPDVEVEGGKAVELEERSSDGRRRKAAISNNSGEDLRKE